MRNENNLHFAVGIYLEEIGGKRLRLVFDDLEGGLENWRKRCLFTFIEVDKGEAQSFQLSREAYAAIGDAVVARLLALDSLTGNITDPR